jgi:hypothetical protein
MIDEVDTDNSGTNRLPRFHAMMARELIDTDSKRSLTVATMVTSPQPS